MEISVFISSKMQELKDERQLLFDFLPTLNNEIVKFNAWIFEEHAPASHNSIRDVYLEALKKSDLYIGIFWNDYGEWTIDEYYKAKEWGIPCHVYVKNVNASQRDAQLSKFLEDETSVTSGITTKWYKSLDDLRIAVETSIKAWINQTYLIRRGDKHALRLNDASSIPFLPDTELIGRELIIEEINQIFESTSSHILLQGFSGVGKTALGAQIAKDWLQIKNSDVIWLRLGSSSKNEATQALAFALNISNQIANLEENQHTLLLSQTLKRENIGLIVIDDVWNGNTLEYIRKLIPNSVKMVATSRRRYILNTIIEVAGLDIESAINLLLVISKDSTTHIDIVKQLCELLDNNPFALEIAGKTIRINNTSVLHFLQELQHISVSQLTIPIDYHLQGYENVAALLEQSLLHVSDNARKVFFGLGAFWSTNITVELITRYFLDIREYTEEELLNLGEESGITHLTVNALKRLLQDVSLGEINVDKEKEALNELYIHGLLKKVNEDNKSIDHYQSHYLAHIYAKATASSENFNKALDACLTYLVRYRDPQINDMFKYVEPELDNLIGAAYFALEEGKYDDVLIIVANLVSTKGILVYRAYYESAIEVINIALQAARLQNNITNVIASLRQLGLGYSALGLWTVSINFHYQALELAQESELKYEIAMALDHLGCAVMEIGDFELASKLFIDALNHADEISNESIKSNVLGNMGTLHAYTGRYHDAVKYTEEALKIQIRIGEKHNQPNQLNNLGNLYAYIKQFDKSTKAFQESITIAQEIGHTENEFLAKINLAALHLNLGEPELALPKLLQLKQEFSQVNIPKLQKNLDLNIEIARRAISNRFK